jgi:hypothetical protein
VKDAVLRTGRMVDTSPPIWELRSARQRRNVYERELVLDEHFASRWSSGTSVAFTFVNGKTLLGALRVNTLIRKPLLKNCRNTAIC